MGSSFYSDSGLTSTEQDSIESAIAAAETAQSGAETAKAAAETAEANAETAEANAETAQAAAEAAQTAAETAETNSSNSASASATSATQSASSATSSASSASTAATKASEASTSASNALTSANNASSSASSSATSATESATSATASASSATSAAASLSSFQNQYLGASSTAPSQDPDGSALDLGDLYFDTSANVMKVYSSSGWTNASSSVNGTSERQTYTATAGQTTFSVTYDAGYVDVWLNGAKLLAGTDFTATSGTNIVLASGAAAGDIVDIIAFGTFVFTSNDHYTKTASDARYEPIDTAYTKAESDARYVELSGDTMTGNLDVTGTVTADGLTVDSSSSVVATIGSSGSSAARLYFDNTGMTTAGDTQLLSQNNDLAFNTNGSEAMRITSSGNAELNGLSNGTLKFAGGNTSDGSKIQAFNNAGTGDGYLAIEGYTKEYMRIDSDGLVTKPVQTCFAVTKNSDFLVNSQSLTTIPFDTKDLDVGNNFNTTTHTFTAPSAGKYLFVLQSTINSINSGTYNAVVLHKNGGATGLRFRALTGSGWTGINASAIVSLAANDTVHLSSYVHSGSMTFQGNEMHFMGYLLG